MPQTGWLEKAQNGCFTVEEGRRPEIRALARTWREPHPRVSRLPPRGCWHSWAFLGLWKRRSDVCLCLHGSVFPLCCCVRLRPCRDTSHGTKCVSMLNCSAVSDSATPRTAARQAPLSVGFSRQGHWSGLPCPPPGDLPDPGIKPGSPALAGGFFTFWATREALIGLRTHPQSVMIPSWYFFLMTCICKDLVPKKLTFWEAGWTRILEGYYSTLHSCFIGFPSFGFHLLCSQDWQGNRRCAATFLLRLSRWEVTHPWLKAVSARLPPYVVTLFSFIVTTLWASYFNPLNRRGSYGSVQV